jgi:hypothetical protein
MKDSIFQSLSWFEYRRRRNNEAVEGHTLEPLRVDCAHHILGHVSSKSDTECQQDRCRIQATAFTLLVRDPTAVLYSVLTLRE